MWVWIVGIIGYLAALVVIFALCNAAKVGDRQSDQFDPDRAFEPDTEPKPHPAAAERPATKEVPEEKPSVMDPTR